jgi:ABC-type multidrug transport system ATPase subunit
MQAFLSNPSIIIADEPTDNLDPETRDIFWDFIYDTRTKHPDLTFFIITHNLDEVEKYTDYIVVIQNGKMKCEQEWKRKANLREAYKEMRSKWN